MPEGSSRSHDILPPLEAQGVGPEKPSPISKEDASAVKINKSPIEEVNFTKTLTSVTHHPELPRDKLDEALSGKIAASEGKNQEKSSQGEDTWKGVQEIASQFGLDPEQALRESRLVHPKKPESDIGVLPIVRSVKEIRGAGADEWLREAAGNKQSSFQEANEVLNLASKFSAAELAQFEVDHTEFQAQLTDSTRILTETFRPQNEQEQRELGAVLYFVRDDMRRIYMETKQAPRSDPNAWDYTPAITKSQDEQIEIVNKALANYEERFWDYGEATLKGVFGENADIPALRQKYEGASKYLASKVAIAMMKEFKSLPLETGELGDRYLEDIKSELEATRGDREGKRREGRKRATAEERLHYNNWREKFDFTWAETAEELEDSVDDWLDYFQQQLPLEAEEAVYQEVTKGMGNALSSLEQARNRIGLEANSARAQHLRERIAGHVTTIAGARLLESRNGFEYFIKLKTDFAANYDPHYDAIYKKKGFAIMADKISENDGAIYRGGRADMNKPLQGDTRTFRSELERDAIKYAENHELHITEGDFENAQLGEREIRQEVARMNLSFNEAQALIKQRMEQRRVAGYKEGRYGWDDGIEELMLVDTRGMESARNIAPNNPNRLEAEARVRVRTRVFKSIKEALDKEDGLAGLSVDQRRQVIRQRIISKMTEEGNTVLLREINALPDQASRDRALWKWVKIYNKPLLEFRREGSSDEPWFPSLWDRERLLIDRPEDLIDRALSEEELKAMVEEINDPHKGLTEEQIERQITGQFRIGIQRAVEARGLSPDESAREFNRLMQARQDDIKVRIEEVLFERKQRHDRAIRNYNLNISQDKFLELQARWGGLTTRKVNKEGKVELVTIFSEAKDLLKKKIDHESREIEDKVDAWRVDFINNNPTLTAEEIAESTIAQRRLFRRNATFAATLGLREIGIAHDLPIWNYYYYGDPSLIGAFAPLVGYTDDDKGKVVELLEKGRREMEAVFAFLAKQYMDGSILEVRGKPGLKVEDEDGNQKDAHEELWVTPRVINEGGVLKLRNLFEARFMISKSGGVKNPDLISKFADLGVYDELWENGCLNKREWQGFRKRRNKWELRTQSFLNTREWADPITHVNRLKGASDANKLLVGGEVQGQGKGPGVLNEPYNGLWRLRVEFYEATKWLGHNLGELLKGNKKIPDNADVDKIIRNEQQFGSGDNLPLTSPKEMKRFRAQIMRILKEKSATDYIRPAATDKLVSVGGEILKFVLNYMNSKDYVKNRANYAPKNWQYDNELVARALFAESNRRTPIIAKKGDLLPDGQIAAGGELLAESGGEVLGGDHLSYAPEGRTNTANDIFMTILRASSYHIFDAAEARLLEGRAKVIKDKMDIKRAELMDSILPTTGQVTINTQKEELRERDREGAQILEEFAKLAIEEKITPGTRVEYGNRLKTKGEEKKKLMIQIAESTNQAIEAELDQQVNTGDLTHQDLKTMIAGRRDELAQLHADPDLGNIELEINSLINQYIDYRLHEEFVGEWPARFVT